MITQTASSKGDRSTNVGRYMVFLTFLFACGLAYEPIYHIVQGSLAYSMIPQDDFYYYYLVAKHLALNGFSSFDGIVPTNGYHPLWMFVLSLLCLITHGNDGITFILIEIVQTLSAMATAALSLHLFHKLYGPQPWVIPISLLISLLLTVLIFLGMETVVAIPLYLVFALSILSALEKQGRLQSSLLCGLAGSCMFLARLDTLIAIGIVVLLFIGLRIGVKRILVFLLGLTPIAIYFVLNRIIFGTWLPVSAEVKVLGGLHFSILPIEVIRTPRGALYFVLTAIGFILTLRNIRHLDTPSAVRLLLFGFPLLFALSLMLTLSWPIYAWYFYPFPIAAGAAVFEVRMLFGDRLKTVIDQTAFAGLIALLAGAIWVLSRDIPGLTTHLNLVESETRAQPNIYIHALGIKPFTDTHPGRYAMGDRAGLTAFITQKSILQIEGLAADEPLVNSIRHDADLFAVLKHYGVKYYIVSYPLREFQEFDNEWDLYEPHQQEVLPWMPLMHGHFYAPEVFRFPLPLDAKLTPEDSSRWVTRILDISQARPINAETN